MKNRNYITHAVTLLLSTSMLAATPVMASSAKSPSVAVTESTNSQQMMQSELDRILAWIPKLKQFSVKKTTTIEKKGLIQVTLQQTEDKDGPRAEVFFDKQTGKFISLSISGESYQGQPISGQLAIQKAKEALQTFYGDAVMKEYRYESNISTGKDGNKITFVRYINDLPFLEDQIRVGIGVDGMVTELSRTSMLETAKLDASSFPSPAEAISQEKLEEYVGKQLQLLYQEDNVTKLDRTTGEQTFGDPLLIYTLRSDEFLDDTA